MESVYQSIDSAPADRTLFVGWAKGEDPAVFYGVTIRGERLFYISADYEGLSNYEPTHWFPLPSEPGGQ